ncbi:MAG: hypothetical protein QM751_05185 [Paludibacteraceae bacterium]
MISFVERKNRIQIMSQYFITNKSDKNLSKIIKGILPNKAKSLDFLVGYFYFSGIEEIYENIEDKKMRILVGLEMERELQNKTYELNSFAKKQKSSRQDIRFDNYESIVKLFSETDFFESNKQQQALKLISRKSKMVLWK